MIKPCLVLLLLLLPPVSGLTGCASLKSPTFQPVAQRLPQEGTRIVVYEVDSRKGGLAENEAVGWLMQKGLTVIERGSIERIFEEQRFTLSHGSESSILRAGHLLGAAQAVFISSGLSDIYLKGVDVESGQVLWAVNGKYPYSCLDRGSEILSEYAMPNILFPFTLP